VGDARHEADAIGRRYFAHPRPGLLRQEYHRVARLTLAAPRPIGPAMPLPPGFVPPCLPTKAASPPCGEAWLHEIKHDGFRVIARKDGARVRLYSRPGNDLTDRFRLIVEALVWLRAGSCIIDGEAVWTTTACRASTASATVVTMARSSSTPST
jgi:bifunctional non-homologous end joining protein LigD